MIPQETIFLLIAILTSATGQFLLKAGALKLGEVSSKNFITHILSIVATPELVAGLTCYGLGAVAYILLLTRVNLSVAAPAIALSYVFSVFIGYFVFREAISVNRAIGLGLIVAGVLLVVWKK